MVIEAAIRPLVYFGLNMSNRTIRRKEITAIPYSPVGVIKIPSFTVPNHNAPAIIPASSIMPIPQSTHQARCLRGAAWRLTDDRAENSDLIASVLCSILVILDI